ncbi:hypothetical protein [Nostoc sp.]
MTFIKVLYKYKIILYLKNKKGDRPLPRICDRLSLNPHSGRQLQ